MDTHRQHTLFECFVKLLTVVRLAVHLNALKAAKDSPECRNRDVRQIVERIAEHGPALLFYTDDAHREAGNLDRPVDRVETREEFFTEFVPDHDHVSCSIHVVGTNESAVDNRLVFDLGHVCSYA